MLLDVPFSVRYANSQHTTQRKVHQAATNPGTGQGKHNDNMLVGDLAPRTKGHATTVGTATNATDALPRTHCATIAALRATLNASV